MKHKYKLKYNIKVYQGNEYITFCFILKGVFQSARSFIDNNYGPMPTDGTREFEIDKNKKKNCKLLVVDDKIKIKIKK